MHDSLFQQATSFVNTYDKQQQQQQQVWDASSELANFCTSTGSILFLHLVSITARHPCVSQSQALDNWMFQLGNSQHFTVSAVTAAVLVSGRSRMFELSPPSTAAWGHLFGLGKLVQASVQQEQFVGKSHCNELSRMVQAWQHVLTVQQQQQHSFSLQPNNKVQQSTAQQTIQVE